MGKDEPQICEKGKAPDFLHVTKLGCRHFFSAIFSGYSMKGSYRKTRVFWHLYEVICTAMSLPVECPSTCKVQQLYQQVGKEKEKELLCNTSRQNQFLCFLNSSEEKHTARRNLVKSVLPFVSCSYKKWRAFSPLAYLIRLNKIIRQ